jgi:putative tryptophan/tyrosine transport system substrate-binding protein
MIILACGFRRGGDLLMIGRRELIAGLGGTVAWPVVTLAQQAERVRRVSLLYPFPEGPSYYAPRVAALREVLAQLGWIEGRNLKINLYPGPQEQISDRAAEVVRSAPDAIVVFGPNATRAVQQQTHTIPIVAVALGDPEAGGLVKSIARPEGNLTGFTNAFASFGGKWVQLLKAVVPQMSRIAMISDISLAVPGQSGLIPPMEAAAKEMGIEAVQITVRTPAEAAVAIRAFAEQPNGALAVVPPMGDLEGPVIRLAA